MVVVICLGQSCRSNISFVASYLAIKDAGYIDQWSRFVSFLEACLSPIDLHDRRLPQIHPFPLYYFVVPSGLTTAKQDEY